LQVITFEHSAKRLIYLCGGQDRRFFTFDAYAAAALDGVSLGKARRQLDELYDQHLITEPAPGRYQLHDLLREHARIMATGTAAAADSEVATGRLLDYYLHTALTAGRHFAPRSSASRRSLPGRPPAQAPELATLGQSAAWLEAERANLQAAADYAAARGRSRYATVIPAAMGGFLAARGHWDQSAALHQSALTAARQAGDRLAEADALSTLGVLQRESGSYPSAAASLARALALYRDIGDQPGEADALNELGFLHVVTGDYAAATASQQQALVLARSTGDRHAEAEALSHLGLVRQLTGDYPAAAASQQQALALFRDLGHRLGQANALNDLGLVQQQTGDYAAAAASHQQALALFADLGNRLGQAEALNRLGELSLRTSATGQARGQHTRALAIARDISAAPEEARALEGIGNSHLRAGNPSQAAAHLQQALAIYQRIGGPGANRVQETHRGPSLPGSAERPDPGVITPTPG
jgi:tetratricopeptide (TPR) repeat protein